MVGSEQLFSIQYFYTQIKRKENEMTVLSYIILSLKRKYRLNRDAKRLENLINMARFAY